MTMPSRVIYLPPGVAAVPPSPPPAAIPSNVPFDRNFFADVLPSAIDSFCKQADCGSPLVEILTVDGTTHYVLGISGVSDSWVALHTSLTDHEHPIQVFVPYTTIFRVGIHPAEDHTRHRLGFITADRAIGTQQPPASSTGAEAKKPGEPTRAKATRPKAK